MVFRVFEILDHKRNYEEIEKFLVKDFKDFDNRIRLYLGDRFLKSMAADASISESWHPNQNFLRLPSDMTITHYLAWFK